MFSRKGYLTMFACGIGAIALMFVAAYPAQAQTAPSSRGIVSPAGGLLQQSGASLSWTVGDLSAGYYRTPDVGLREGFLSVPLRITRIAPLPASWSVSVFPNPVSADLSVAIQGTHPGVTLQLFDLAGRVLTNAQMTETNNAGELSMRQLPPGSYFLRVHDAAGAVSAVYQIKKIK